MLGWRSKTLEDAIRNMVRDDKLPPPDWKQFLKALRSAVAARAAAHGTPGDAADAVDDISQLSLPVGWGANAPDDVPSAIPGWIITIAALSLGAPFWFDLLSRLARLRGSGVPERPRSLSHTAGTVEAERADRAAARMRFTAAGTGRRLAEES